MGTGNTISRVGDEEKHGRMRSTANVLKTTGHNWVKPIREPLRYVEEVKG